MAYDEGLATRIRDAIGARSGLAADRHAEDDDLRRWVDRRPRLRRLPAAQGAVTPPGDPLDPVAVAAEIDHEVRVLPGRGVQPVRVVRRAVGIALQLYDATRGGRA